jgi:hypothetical protein
LQQNKIRTQGQKFYEYNLFCYKIIVLKECFFSDLFLGGFLIASHRK